MLTLAVVFLGFEAVMFVAAIFGEVSMAVTIVTGYSAPAAAVGLLCYFGFGIVLTAVSVCALVPAARGISHPERLTRKSADLSIDLCILLFVLLVAVYIAKTVLEPILVTDLQCVLYYACYSYSPIASLCGVIALAAAALVYAASRDIGAGEEDAAETPEAAASEAPDAETPDAPSE